MPDPSGSPDFTATHPDLHATRRTRARYARIAPIYDVMEAVAEARYRPWRQRLWELRRVVRPGGSVILLEHVRSDLAALGRVMDLLDPLVVRAVGANINRRTVDNVKKAGLRVEQVEDLGAGGIFKLILARVPMGEAEPIG